MRVHIKHTGSGDDKYVPLPVDGGSIRYVEKRGVPEALKMGVFMNYPFHDGASVLLAGASDRDSRSFDVRVSDRYSLPFLVSPGRITAGYEGGPLLSVDSSGVVSVYRKDRRSSKGVRFLFDDAVRIGGRGFIVVDAGEDGGDVVVAEPHVRIGGVGFTLRPVSEGVGPTEDFAFVEYVTNVVYRCLLKSAENTHSAFQRDIPGGDNVIPSKVVFKVLSIPSFGFEFSDG